MLNEILVGLLLLSPLWIGCFVRNIISKNSNVVELKKGYIPPKSGKYYIIVNINGKEKATVDTYNADSMQWTNTKNILKITHFSEY